MKKSWKNTLMTFACIGALFTATEASARGHHHHHHGSKDLHRAAAIVDIVVNGLTGLSILNGNAPVVVQPAPTVVTPAPVCRKHAQRVCHKCAEEIEQAKQAKQNTK